MDAMAEGGLITVSVSSENGSVAVRISDDGPGLPDEIAAHLFEPFHTTKPKGHGLGLFAVKHIVEMYHGSVEVETAKGAGTSFTVRLPAVADTDWVQTHDFIDIVSPEECEADEHAEVSNANPHQ